MPEHVDIVDPEIHEPKGVAAASDNTVMQASSGASTWAKVGSSNINTSSIFNTNKYHIYTYLTDVSTADFILVPIPVSSTLTRVTTILHAAITTPDSTVTLTNSTGPATVGTITIAFTGSAEGDIDTLTPASNNTFAAGTYLKIATDGDSGGTAKLGIFLEFTRTT